MKFNLNNPAFLQMAGNSVTTHDGLSFIWGSMYPGAKPGFILTTSSSALVRYLENGVSKTMQIASANDLLVEVPADENTEIRIVGDVLKFSTFNNKPLNALKSIDTSACHNLNYLNVQSNPNLLALNLIQNKLLNFLELSACTGLVEISVCAINSDIASSIASAITSATSVDGTVTLRQGDEFNQTIIDAAMEKGWDVQYAE